MRLGPFILILCVPWLGAQTNSRALLDRYCAACHNQKLRTAGLAFEDLRIENVRSGADIWERILRQVRTGEMPPPGMPRPSEPVRADFVAAVQDGLDRAAAADPNPGRPPIHRLNRTEYGNAIRDLLGLEIDSSALLPPDDSGYGFDNIADVLSVSPALLERTLSAARRISRLAVSRPEGRPSVFVCQPVTAAADVPCARTILSALARRAYRRPVTQADLKPLLSFFSAGRKSGGFDRGMERALTALLASPDFLLRIERDPAGSALGTVHRISDLELASRLSFFLWSSIPDDELLDLAEQCKLRNPGVLEHQVRRMLDDPRSHTLVTNFAGQWLDLRRLPQIRPNTQIFSEFDNGLRQDFQRETELFLESVIHEDRSLVDLLDADYTFLNERLARHYGIPGVLGAEFRRVTLPDTRRGGLLGQGSILTLTSYSTRTSVVLRGKWILENLLGEPPPPPPPDVPALQPEASDGKPLSVRQQMQLHRSNAVCASCHARMDPLGFALENYDGVGKWRTDDAGAPIDASGKLPDGTEFIGPAGLRKVLVSRRQEFIATVTTKLLTYALGRGLEFYDQPAVRAIDRTAGSDSTFSSLVLGIVNSPPFQMTRSR
ncbi:MAG: DUF1592 domain-containing protein [Acidobacteriia bacterium]|nr:DUF1592 domain-containing protein [Terriglobia bacterium]